ncbi:MAG: NADPH:quinone oxidoreductase family protein [Sphingomicrobium sp.]
MRALRSHSPGGPETLVLDDVDDPVAGAGQLLVRVRACAINYPDVLIIEDKYQFKPERPFAPGGEVAGVVEALGEGVSGWAIGDRLIAYHGHGGLADRVAVPITQAYKIPARAAGEFPDAEVASLLITYATVIHALKDRAQAKAGESMLLLGAAGGIGLSAIELGKALGLRVVAAVSSEAKAAATREAGADATLVYPSGEIDKEASKALAGAFKAAAGPNGFDIVFDPVGGAYAEPALRSLGWQGRYLVVGFPAGIPSIPLNLTLLKSCDIRGVFWGAFALRDPAANAAHVDELFRLWGEGKIGPRVSQTFPLERAGEAIAALRDRKAVGKLVITL